MSKNNLIRKGCKDIWNAFMCKGAIFSVNDIPFCPTTAENIPNDIIPWNIAEQLYRNEIYKKNKHFFYDVFVCWYIDDYKFDGPKGIWNNYAYVLKVLQHFAGAITPDFSTYQDFPKPIKLYNFYRMRAFGFWLGKNGISVINNVRWGTRESWNYCWDGIPSNSIVCIGTVGGSPRGIVNRKRFEEGLEKLVQCRNPHTILVYGSANYECFFKLISQGIKIISYQSYTASVFERRCAR